MPQTVDLFVDQRIFFDVRVGGRNVGFWLIIIVVTYKILYRIVREEVLELPIQLGRERLVGGEHQGGAIGLRDDVRNRKGLA